MLPARLKVGVCSIAVAVILVLPGCPSAYVGGPKTLDSWAHFAAGGAFAGGRPSVAPDGMTFVYASPRTGHGDIYRVNIDGSETTRLTTDEGFESSPTFSPDGSRIAFEREGAGFGRIWIMDADGTNQKQLTDGFWDTINEFSADGSEIVFARAPASSYGGVYPELFAVNLESGAVSRMPKRPVSISSPDGSKFLYTKRGARENEIWSIDRTTSREQRVGAGWSPSFSPDGTQFVHIGPRLQPKEVWITTVDGKDSRQVTTPSRYIIDGPSFCPNGVDIIFLATDDIRAVGDIFLVNTDTGVATCVTSTE